MPSGTERRVKNHFRRRRGSLSSRRRIRRVNCKDRQRIEFHRVREWLEVWLGCGKGEGIRTIKFSGDSRIMKN